MDTSPLPAGWDDRSAHDIVDGRADERAERRSRRGGEGMDRVGQRRLNRLRDFARRYWEPYLLFAPTALLMLVVLLYPLTYGIQLSFTNKEFLGKSVAYVGIANYVRLSGDLVFWKALGNTALWTLYVVVGRLTIGLLLALVLHQIAWGRRLLRVLYLLPWAVPSIVVGIMFIWLYDPTFGYVNQYLRHVKLISQPILFLVDRSLVLPAVVLPAIWKGYPFAMLALLAALQSVDRDLYEAAAVDGANRWHRFVHITLPGIRPVLVLMILLETIWVFNNFDFVYILTRGGPGNLTQLLSTYSYMAAFDSYRPSYGATIATVQFAILLAVSVIYIRIYGFRADEG